MENVWVLRERTYHLLPKLFIRPPQPYHNRYLQLQITKRHNDAIGNHIAARQPAEDIDEDGFHARVGGDDAEGGFDGFGGGFAACVKEVGAVAAVKG